MTALLVRKGQGVALNILRKEAWTCGTSYIIHITRRTPSAGYGVKTYQAEAAGLYRRG
jgi:hypothetical protein